MDFVIEAQGQDVSAGIPEDKSATALRAVCRRYLARVHIATMRKNYTGAQTKLAALVRKRACAQKFAVVRSSVTTIQSRIRGMWARKEMARRLSACTLGQRLVRGFLARRMVHRLKDRSTRLQILVASSHQSSGFKPFIEVSQ